MRSASGVVNRADHEQARAIRRVCHCAPMNHAAHGWAVELTNSAKDGPDLKVGAVFRPLEGCQPLCDFTASVSCGATLNRSPTMP